MAGGSYILNEPLVRNQVWNGSAWVPETQPGGGGGGAVTIADGADVAEGATTDAKVVGDNAGTVSAKLRGLNYLLALVTDTVNNRLNVFIQNTTLAVTQGGSWVLSAGSALIGKVGIDQTTPGTTNNVNVDSATGAGAVIGATNGAAVITDANGTLQQYLRGIVKLAITVGGWLVTAQGDVANDAADSGNPVKIGARAIAFGSSPTAVASGDRVNAQATCAGQPFVLPGHPNVITRRDNYDAAQTDTAIISVSAGTKIVVLACTVAADAANSAKPAVRVGFGAANTPTGAGTYLSHPGVPAGGGIREAGAVAGADGEDFRITCAEPTDGSIDVVTKYFTIAEA